MEKEIKDRNNLLLKFFEENKEASIRLHYSHDKKGIPCDISFEKLYEIIKLKMEKEDGSVHMD